MKKLMFNMRFLVGIGVALLAMACAQDGMTDETFAPNLPADGQLVTPEIGKANFKNTAGVVTFSWDVVQGAGGYAVKVINVSDEANPVTLVDEVVDGCTLTFEAEDENEFYVSVRAIANPKWGTKDALETSEYTYSTWPTLVPVPADVVELSAWINENLSEPEDADLGQALVLEGGKEYTLTGKADLLLYNTTVRGSQGNPAVIKVSDDGMFVTQAGLKFKYVNFDCTDAKATSLLAFSDEPDESLSTESLGYKADGANQNGYVINKPIIFEECWIRNLPKSFIWGSKKNWSLRYLRILNSIIQLDNSGSNACIDFSGASNGLIKELIIRNSTFYNLSSSGSGYFLRYSNASNAQPQKIFGNSDKAVEHHVEDCTFAKTFVGQKFANNLPTYNTCTTYMSNCIFYDVYEINQYLVRNGNTIRYVENNTIWAATDGKSVAANDVGGWTDTNGNPYATEENPGFTEPFAALDFNLPNGGVTFLHPTGAISSNGGDPRWR